MLFFCKRKAGDLEVVIVVVQHRKRSFVSPADCVMLLVYIYIFIFNTDETPNYFILITSCGKSCVIYYVAKAIVIFSRTGV